MASEDDERKSLLPYIVTQQGRGPGTRITATLLRALAHSNPNVRLSAAVSLASRRDRTALPGLIEQYGQEDVSGIQAVVASAILASGADSAASLIARNVTPAIDLWWSVLAHRTRDVDAADRLVSIAINRDQSWSIRRAAIAAAGRLPYEKALARIEPSVMAERSPILLDQNRSLLGHDAVGTIIPQAAVGLTQFFRGDRAGFVRCFEPYFEGFWKRTLDPTGLPRGADIAGWLYDALAGMVQLPGPELNQLSDSVHVPLLQAAVLRSLRLCGRSDRIDANLAVASNVWVAVRALRERLRFPDRGPTLGQSLQILVEGTTWADDRVVKDFISRLATLPMTNAGAVPTATPPTTHGVSAAPTLTYDAAVRLLSSGTENPVSDGPLVFERLSADECRTLIGLADPANDPERGETTYTHAVAFTTEGHVVTQRRTTYRGSSFPDRLRLAIAAANRFDLPMPWHRKQLEGPLANTYASEFLSCLSALGDSERFYATLAEAEDALLPALCERADTLSDRIVLDNRLIPALTRYLAVGGDDLFKGLCILVKRIDIPEIQPILEGLLQRWVQRFDVQAARPQNDEAYSLWHGFARLSEHPRFEAIPNWTQQLTGVLRAPMAWFHAQSIVRVLERDAGSYTLIEARLFKETNWEHYPEDEVERLDRAAEMLFGRIQDSSIP